MSAFRRRLLTVAFAAAAAAALPARELHFGLEVHGSFPQTDLKHDVGAKMGTGAFGYALLDLYGGHALRGRFGYSSARNEDFHSAVAGVGPGHPFRVRTYTLGADYQFFLDRKTGEGWYLSLGAGLDRVQSSWDSPSGLVETARTKPTLSAGAGIILVPHVGFEARYVMGRYPSFDALGNTWGASSDRMEAGIVFLF